MKYFFKGISGVVIMLLAATNSYTVANASPDFSGKTFIFTVTVEGKSEDVKLYISSKNRIYYSTHGATSGLGSCENIGYVGKLNGANSDKSKCKTKYTRYLDKFRVKSKISGNTLTVDMKSNRVGTSIRTGKLISKLTTQHKMKFSFDGKKCQAHQFRTSGKIGLYLLATPDISSFNHTYKPTRCRVKNGR